MKSYRLIVVSARNGGVLSSSGKLPKIDIQHIDTSNRTPLISVADRLPERGVESFNLSGDTIGIPDRQHLKYLYFRFDIPVLVYIN